MLMNCEAMPARPIAVPRPSSAVTIGRPIASAEPNVSSRTIIAAIRPTARREAERRLVGLLDRLPAELDLDLI